MSFISLKTSKKLTLNQEKNLKESIGQLVCLYLDDHELMIHIEDNQMIYFKGKEIECMHIECQLIHPIDQSCLQVFIHELMRQIEKITTIPVANQYLMIKEFKYWGINGQIFEKEIKI